MAAIFVYVGVNLLPGLNTTVATITTPTYDAGVAGLMTVVLIVFAAMNQKYRGFQEQSWSNNGENCGKPKSFRYGNPQPSRMNSIKVIRKVQRLGVELVKTIRPHKHPASHVDDEIVHSLLKSRALLYIGLFLV